MTDGLRRALAVGLIGSLGLLTSSVAGAATNPPVASVDVPQIGPGYAVTSQGPLNPSQFASSSPDPSAAAGALGALSHSITTYQRVWQDSAMDNEVQDLVVHFDSASGAEAFEKAAQHGLSSGEIIGTTPVASIPGAMRTTYFATTTQIGVGQAITLRVGDDVVLLSMFSANSPDNLAPITASDATTIAQAQFSAVKKSEVTPPRGRQPAPPKRSLATEALFAVAIIILYALWARRSRRLKNLPSERGPLGR